MDHESAAVVGGRNDRELPMTWVATGVQAPKAVAKSAAAGGVGARRGGLVGVGRQFESQPAKTQNEHTHNAPEIHHQAGMRRARRAAIRLWSTYSSVNRS